MTKTGGGGEEKKIEGRCGTLLFSEATTCIELEDALCDVNQHTYRYTNIRTYTYTYLLYTRYTLDIHVNVYV